MILSETTRARLCFNTENGRGRAAIAGGFGHGRERLQMFQYRERSWEGCNTVPLSPWGYWPQMSKLENLGGFLAFRRFLSRALFAFSAIQYLRTLAV